MTKEEPEGELVLQVVAMPANTNANGDIFGGWLVANMDMGAGIAAKRRANSRTVTVAINDLVFIKPVAVGATVAVYATLIKVGRTSMQFDLSVWALNPDALDEVKVASGKFTFVAINNQGVPHPVDR